MQQLVTEKSIPIVKNILKMTRNAIIKYVVKFQLAYLKTGNWL